MITRTATIWQANDWQLSLKSMIRSLDELCQHLDIEIKDLPLAYAAEQDFAVKVPLAYLGRMEKGNARDPLLLQVLPQAAEMLTVEGFSEDPLQEAAFNPVPGLIHKYHNRVLLISNPSCAIHCRYCFRRHFPYQENTPGSQHWAAVLDYIRENSVINEVILSGGDPLSNNDRRLQSQLSQIAMIDHVKTLRIHTRLAVAMPERITQTLINLLTDTPLKVIMVLHINHANEIDDSVIDAVRQMQRAGIRLLNQSVLLKGVNNTEDDQINLLQRLHEFDIQAYYLHVLDKTQGAAHFLCSDDEAKLLYEAVRAKVSGYMLPRLARETAHDIGKTILSTSSYADQDDVSRLCNT